MKNLVFLIMFFAIPAMAFCQEENAPIKKISIADISIHGYIDNIRLDSLPGKFLIVETSDFSGTHIVDRYDVDYGQSRPKFTQTVVKNLQGENLKFNSLATLLSFFDYNGWQYKETVTSPAFGRFVEVVFCKK